MVKSIQEFDLAAMAARGDQRRDGFGEMEWVDLVQSQLTALKGAQKFCIGAAAGTKGFDCQCGAIGGAQMAQQERCEHGFADIGVGAGDEDEPGLDG